MAATSAWWIERVLPHVATRQSVMTVPWKRRWLLARHPELASGVHTVALRTIERWCAAAAGAPKTGRTGAVTATQRFSSALNLKLHFHCIFLDGIYTRGADDDAQAVIQQASLLGQAVLGDRAGKRARRAQVLGGKELALPPRCASFAGYSLHAGVGFKASDRAGLERLCRYILRPPLAKDRLQRHDDGNDLSGSCRRERSVAR